MAKRPTKIRDLKADDLHKTLQLSRSYASELINRKKTPSLELAVKIETAFGVPASAWLERGVA